MNAKKKLKQMNKMLKTLQKAILISFVIVLSGCGTVTPKAIEHTEAHYDATTPSNYPEKSSGLISQIKNDRGEYTHCIVTDGWVEKYNFFISKYRLQLQNEKGVLLSENAGVEDYADAYKSKLHKVDNEHYQYYLKLNRWSGEGRDGDSLWMKTKNLIP